MDFTPILANLGIAELNDLQRAALQAIEREPNTVLLAPTGSGKTLAFLLPILQRLKPEAAGVQALIVSPTRELALQIERVWQQMGTGFKVNTVYGGHSMPLEVQSLRQPPALLIGTPGRVLEHLTRKTFDAGMVTLLVLDEFDKSLALGFHEHMEGIVKALPKLAVRVLASATNKLHLPAFTGIDRPHVLNFNKAQAKSTENLALKTVLAPEEDAHKIDTLFRLLGHFGAESTLVFCNQREATEWVAQQLQERGLECAFFHGGLEQPDREKMLVRFRNGSVLFLIASDLAARGLDIPEVRHVVHYELPLHEKEFIHRNGRTARMHAEGTAYLLVHAGEALPAYLSELPEAAPLPDRAPEVPVPAWTTIYISGGKKNKLSKTDIVGFFSQKGGLAKDDLGRIDVLDFMAFAAVKRHKVAALLAGVRGEKMKGERYKIVVAK
jgi:superfamily II DNA/RNA helicase